MQKQKAVAIQSDEIRRRELRQDASPFILKTSVRQSLDKSDAGNSPQCNGQVSEAQAEPLTSRQARLRRPGIDLQSRIAGTQPGKRQQ